MRPWYLPWSISRVPGWYLRSSHGWLKNVAFMIPVASTTVASTSGFIPRRRTGRERIERTSTTTVATSSVRQLGDRPRLGAVARQVLEQVADRVQPEPLGALAGGGRAGGERLGQARRAREAPRPQLSVRERGRGRRTAVGYSAAISHQ